jgi:hypothetical protein
VSGSFTSPSPVRETLATNNFVLSLNQGELAALKNSAFSYKGTTGAAIAIYTNAGAVV